MKHLEAQILSIALDNIGVDGYSDKKFTSLRQKLGLSYNDLKHFIPAIKQGNHCPQGSPLTKNQKLRLQHAPTRKWLHSHLHLSPLSQNQEVGSRIKSSVGRLKSFDFLCSVPMSCLIRLMTPLCVG